MYNNTTVKEVSTGYCPRPLQAVLHRSVKRFNVIVCHRRFGKTVWSINEMVDKGLRSTLKNPQYAYLAPTYGQAKRVAWDYLKEYTKNIPGRVANEAELRIDITMPDGNRIRFMLLGAENPGTLRGIYLDGIILDEYAECDPSVWSQVVRPALSDRLGWAIFIGTPKGQNHFFDIYEYAKTSDTWYTSIFKASETNIINATELMAAKAEMSEEEYEQEYECSFTAALVGSYYGKLLDIAEKEKRIGVVPYDPNVSVDTFWDLGIGDTTAIWFHQQVGQEHHIIDHLEMSGVGLDWYVRELQKKPYIYEEHGLPHDAQARELGTGRSRLETLQKLGLKRLHIIPKLSVEDGIHASRMFLPKCWFDAIKCHRGLLALKNYQKKWDAKNQIFMDKPKHDWASNSADSFRYMAVGVTPNQIKMSRNNLPKKAIMDYDIFGGR